MEGDRGMGMEARGEGGGLFAMSEKGGGLDVGGECPGDREILRLKASLVDRRGAPGAFAAG